MGCCFLTLQGASPSEVAHNIIGQFGVGFYSAFMVADSISVWTQSARPNEPGYLWTSAGCVSYSSIGSITSTIGSREFMIEFFAVTPFEQGWELRDSTGRRGSTRDEDRAQVKGKRQGIRKLQDGG